MTQEPHIFFDSTLRTVAHEVRGQVPSRNSIPLKNLDFLCPTVDAHGHVLPASITPPDARFHGSDSPSPRPGEPRAAPARLPCSNPPPGGPGRQPPSQTWRTFLHNHLADLVALDFFTVPTATFRVLFVCSPRTLRRGRKAQLLFLGLCHGEQLFSIPLVRNDVSENLPPMPPCAG